MMLVPSRPNSLVCIMAHYSQLRSPDSPAPPLPSFPASRISDESCLISALPAVEADAVDDLSRVAFERRIHRLEQDNKDLTRRLAGACTLARLVHVFFPLMMLIRIYIW